MVDRSKFRATSIIPVLKDVFNNDIQAVQFYINAINSHLDSKTIELDMLYRQGIEEYMEAAFDDEYLKYGSTFPQILTSSVLISIHTIFEVSIKRLVVLCNHIFFPGTVLPKRNGNQSETGHYMDLLINRLGLPVAGGHNRLLLDNFRIIRNLFAHQNGNLSQEHSTSKREKLKEIIADSHGSLTYNETSWLVTVNDVQYLLDYTKVIVAYMDPIYDALFDRHNILLDKM